MSNRIREQVAEQPSTRRGFLEDLSKGTVAGGVVGSVLAGSPSVGAERSGPGTPGKVGFRTLGKTGLKVSEVGFGGHSWAYKRTPDGRGGYRQVTVDEAVEMISAGIDMGVNFLDSCTAHEESIVPGEALKRLRKRDDMIVSIRVSHKMKGTPDDQKEIYRWTEDRLRMWQTDRVDLCLLCNTENDTPRSGYWDLSYSIEALDKLKKQGKIRYTGFGCHFEARWFLHAFEHFGDYFDIVSMPYNIRHRAAKEILPAAKKKNLGVITIKPFARGAFLKDLDLKGKDAGLPRDMMAFVLEDENVDLCTCGVHTLAQVRENFSASWTRLSPEARQRLAELAAVELAAGEHAWLEQGWRYA